MKIFQFKPKFEAQSAHFSGKQQTLHCCVHEKAGEIKYLYHLSDDKVHDSVMTFSVIESIIEHDPSVIESGILVLHSDNAPTQYKSRFVFALLLKLNRKYMVRAVWFYGIVGHGRGLVDAMSSFGCKRPLQNAIETDKWFSCAQEMVVFLSDKFSNDKYYYFEIDQRGSKKRKEKRKEHFLKGSTRMHMITVKDDIFHTQDILCTRDDALLTLRFDEANEDSGSDDDDDDDDGQSCQSAKH